MSNAYGAPLVKVGRMAKARVGPRAAGGDSPWELTVSIIPPKKKKAVCFNRDFPVHEALIAWGEHAPDLSGLPLLTSGWHCKNFPALWQGVSRRFHATAKHDVWLDTTHMACDRPK
jgi:hypothetical protein